MDIVAIVYIQEEQENGTIIRKNIKYIALVQLAL